ncbi:hypothetical protein DWV97_08790 [Ruminococcus sp. AF14-10]|nr:hypothetical protein DWV97_08790 [Ruminococcus sp. AF14-10]
MIPVILVVDYGTSNVRVNAVEVDGGKTVESNSIKYRPIVTQSGYYELDAEQMWDETQKCMEKTVKNVELEKYIIKGISFSFFGDSFVPVDEKGNATHNLFLCFDPRGEEEAKEIMEQVGKKKILHLIGDTYESGCTGAKILYFKKHFPELDKKTAKYDSIQQFILGKIGVEDVNDITMACRKSMMNNEKMVWSDEILNAVGVKENELGKIVDPTCKLGEISKFGEVDLPYPVMVFPGAHDSDCGYVGLGINEESKSCVAEVAGTFDHIGMIIGGHVNCHELHPTEDIWSGRGPLPDSTSALSAFATSGALMEWFMTEIVGNSEQEMYKDLWDHAEFNGEEGVELTPRFAMSDGMISGLSITSTKYDIFRAIVEMLTFETRRCIELCQKVNPYGIDIVRIGGGGARERKWVQLRADITGKVYQSMNEIESSALGSAMLATVGLGIYENVADAAKHMVGVKETFKPNKEIQKRYEEKYQRYLAKNYS